MTSRLHSQAVAFALAVATTLALLGSVEHLATSQPSAELMARIAAAGSQA